MTKEEKVLEAIINNKREPIEDTIIEKLMTRSENIAFIIVFILLVINIFFVTM